MSALLGDSVFIFSFFANQSNTARSGVHMRFFMLTMRSLVASRYSVVKRFFSAPGRDITPTLTSATSCSTSRASLSL